MNSYNAPISHGIAPPSDFDALHASFPDSSLFASLMSPPRTLNLPENSASRAFTLLSG